ncbi:MAG TPA: nitroreductase family protein [Bacillota bacterium]
MDLKKVFEERRSVNFFKPDCPIEKDVLRNIIKLAALTPSAFNLQPWEIIAVQSAAAKEKLFSLAGNQLKIKEAPVTLIIIGDLEGYQPENPAWDDLEAMLGSKQALEEYQKAAHALYGSSEDGRIKFAESNAALLAMSIMYAAKYYGLDTHPMSGIDFEGIRKEFGLDENKTVVMLIALGYFDDSKTLYPRRMRKDYEDIVKEV